MSDSPVDRNLLLGILAFKHGFVERSDAVTAMDEWVADKSVSLGETFMRSGLLTAVRLAELEEVVNRHIRDHQGSVHSSLGAEITPPVAASFSGWGDPQVDDSLSQAVEATAALGTSRLWLTEASHTTEATQHYRFMRMHAIGGIGLLSVVKDECLNRDVVLKELKLDYENDPNSRERFIQEAEITAGLEHPGIVPVYGRGLHEDGRPFFVMRMVKGKSLRDEIDGFHAGQANLSRRSLALRNLLTRFSHVCNAIEYAHSRGVLHRDIKPSNIMLGKYGETLVVDWGLAKSRDYDDITTMGSEPLIQPVVAGDFDHTRHGNAIGTPAFMSPEQAAGEMDRVATTTDVYGLGATLYYILTGRAPFDAAVLHAEGLGAVRNGDYQRPSSIDRRVSRSLESICEKAMAREPRDRYPSVAAMSRDIECWLADEPVPAHEESFVERVARSTRNQKSWLHRSTAALSVLILGLAVAIVWVSLRERNAIAERDLARQDQADISGKMEQASDQLDVTKKELDEATAAGRSLEQRNQTLRDGKNELARRLNHSQVLVFAEKSHHLRRTDPPESLKMAVRCAEESQRGVELGNNQIAFAHQVLWQAFAYCGGRPLSSRGRGIKHLAVVGDYVFTAHDDGVIWRRRINETESIKRQASKGIQQITASPDGKLVGHVSDGKVYLWDFVKQGGKKAFARIEINEEVRPQLLFLDKSHLLAFGASGRLHICEYNSQSAKSIGSTPCMLQAWSAEAKMLATSDNAEITIRRLDQLHDEASVIRIPMPAKAARALSLSYDGSRLAVADTDDVIYVLDLSRPERKEAVRLSGPAQAVEQMEFRGSSLVATTADHGLWLWKLGGSHPKPIEIGKHRGPIRSVALDPSGRWLATVGADRSIQLWSLGDPQRDAILLRGHIGDVADLEFTEDGKLLISAGADGAPRIWRIGTGRLVPTGGDLARIRLDSIAVSADSRTVAIAETVNGKSQVRLSKIRGVPARLVTAMRLPQDQPVTGLSFDGPDGSLVVETADGNGKRYATANAAPQPFDKEATAELMRKSRSRKAKEPPPNHRGRVAAVAQSPDGRWRAVGGADGNISLYDMESSDNRSFHVWQQPSSIASLSFTRDGNYLVSLCCDGRLRVWEHTLNALIKRAVVVAGN